MSDEQSPPTPPCDHPDQSPPRPARTSRPRGFAALKQRARDLRALGRLDEAERIEEQIVETARQGALRAQALGKAHRWSTGEAKVAGSKGGQRRAERQAARKRREASIAA